MDEYCKLVQIVKPLYNWVAGRTPGERYIKSIYKYNDKQIWIPVKNLLLLIQDKQIKTQKDFDFLKCRYKGEFVYRIQRYNPRKRTGHIINDGFYHSWSQFDGVGCVPIHGDVMVIKQKVDRSYVAIDVVELIQFLEKYYPGCTNGLSLYFSECEVEVPIYKNLVVDIKILDAKNVDSMENAPSLNSTIWFYGE